MLDFNKISRSSVLLVRNLFHHRRNAQPTARWSGQCVRATTPFARRPPNHPGRGSQENCAAPSQVFHLLRTHDIRRPVFATPYASRFVPRMRDEHWYPTKVVRATQSASPPPRTRPANDKRADGNFQSLRSISRRTKRGGGRCRMRFQEDRAARNRQKPKLSLIYLSDP